MILDRLAMVETAMSPRSSGSGAVKGTNRATLRELLEFFTGPVDVHFKREEMLVDDLRRILGRKQEEQKALLRSFVMNARLRTKPGDDASAEFLESVRGGQSKQLQSLHDEISALTKRLGEVSPPRPRQPAIPST